MQRLSLVKQQSPGTGFPIVEVRCCCVCATGKLLNKPKDCGGMCGFHVFFLSLRSEFIGKRANSFSHPSQNTI